MYRQPQIEIVTKYDVMNDSLDTNPPCRIPNSEHERRSKNIATGQQ